MALIVFIFGLAVGSFLNVVALRYGEEPVGGRSHCPHCKKTLRWYELIPLFSFLIQGGKCRSCGAKISWQYPIGELLTAVIFVLLFKYFTGLELAIWLVAGAALIALALIDYRLFIIPDGLNLLLAVLGIGLMILKSSYLSPVLAALGGLAFFGGIVFFSRGRAMGMGDVKLAGAMGLLLGWPGALIAFMASFIIGAIWGVGLILAGKKTMKDAVPFGPFLVVGVFVSLFLEPLIFGII